MDKGIFLFEKVDPNIDFINEIFTFDVRKLDMLSGATISKYATALSQYLIYFKTEINKTRVSIHQKQRALDSGVDQVLTKDILKEYKTKTAAVEYIVSNSQFLTTIRTEIDLLKEELMRVEGVDRMISDLIATLKRELTRRDNELYIMRKERYS